MAQKLQLRPRQKWPRALGNTTDGVFIVDGAQRIIYWNKAAERILGYSQAEASNQHCYGVLAGRCYAKLWCYAGCKVHRWGLRGILPNDFDLLTQTKEGKDIWIKVSTIVLPGRKKPLLAHLFRDVSDQKRNEEVIKNILNLLGVRRFPKGNPEGDGVAPLYEKRTVRTFICRENGLSALSRREGEGLLLLAEGLPTIAIAQQMGVSPFTVRNHIRNVLKRLGVHSKAQAVSFAFTSGLVHTEPPN